MTPTEWAEWAGRLSVHLEFATDDSGPEWLRIQRRDNARELLARFHAATQRPAHDDRGFVDLPGLAEV